MLTVSAIEVIILPIFLFPCAVEVKLSMPCSPTLDALWTVGLRQHVLLLTAAAQGSWFHWCGSAGGTEQAGGHSEAVLGAGVLGTGSVSVWQMGWHLAEKRGPSGREADREVCMEALVMSVFADEIS